MILKYNPQQSLRALVDVVCYLEILDPRRYIQNMLTKTDLLSISQVIKKTVRQEVEAEGKNIKDEVRSVTRESRMRIQQDTRELSDRIKNLEIRVSDMNKDMKEQFNKVQKEIKTSVNFLDKDYVKLRTKVDKLEKNLHFAQTT